MGTGPVASYVLKGRDRVTLLAAELWPPTHATA
jgi:hypothetical protein